MKHLVECGLNIDITEGRFEQSAAHLAAFAGHVDVLQWLLENGSSGQKQVRLFIEISFYILPIELHFHPEASYWIPNFTDFNAVG